MSSLAILVRMTRAGLLVILNHEGDMADGLRPPLHSSAAPRDKEPDEPDKLLKWQQERIDRKLRGQYESAVLHLSEVVSILSLHRKWSWT